MSWGGQGRAVPVSRVLLFFFDAPKVTIPPYMIRKSKVRSGHVGHRGRNEEQRQLDHFFLGSFFLPPLSLVRQAFRGFIKKEVAMLFDFGKLFDFGGC